MAICLVRDLSCRQLQSEWCERRLLRVAAAGWIPRRFRQRWLWSRSSWTWGYGPRRHGVSSDFNVTNCSLLSRSLIWLSGITRHMQGLYVQVSKKSGVSCVVHPTYFICRGFYDTPSVLLEGCFILVLHMANVIFIIIILIRLRQRKSFICTFTGLCLFCTHGYFKCGSVSNIWGFYLVLRY